MIAIATDIKLAASTTCVARIHGASLATSARIIASCGGVDGRCGGACNHYNTFSHVALYAGDMQSRVALAATNLIAEQRDDSIP